MFQFESHHQIKLEKEAGSQATSVCFYASRCAGRQRQLVGQHLTGSRNQVVIPFSADGTSWLFEAINCLNTIYEHTTFSAFDLCLYLPRSCSAVLVAMTVRGAIPPKLRAISLMTGASSSKRTLIPALTVAMSPSFRRDCL